LKLQKAAVRTGQALLLFVICYYLVYHNLIQNWHKLADYQWSLRWLPFSLSLLGVSLTFAANTQIWRMIVRSLSGVSLPPYRSVYIWFMSNLGRYLPGKVWQIAGMAMMARGLGVPGVEAAASSVLAIVICMLAGACLGLALFPAALAGSYAPLVSWAWLGLPVMLAFLHPALLNRLIRLVSKWSGKPAVMGNLRLRDLLLWFTLNLLVWIVYGVCFYYFIHSVIPEARLSLGDAVGIYAVGYIIGFLMIFAPGGLGVRESVFVLLLTTSLGDLGAVVVALISRIWLTLAELVPVAILLWISGLPGKLTNSVPRRLENENG